MRRAAATRTLGALAAVAVVVASAAGCATTPGASATAEELRAAFAPCGMSVEATYEARSFLVDMVETWYPVGSVLEARREPEDEGNHLPGRITTPDGTEVPLVVHYTDWPGIDWALAHDAPVWVGVVDPAEWEDRPMVAAVMIQAPDGGIVFAGECRGVILDEPLHTILGADADAILAQVPTVDDATARELLGMELERPAAGPTILNPEDTPAEVLDRLGRVRLNIRVTDSLGTGEDIPGVCLHITEGWSDCLPADAVAVDGSDLMAYVGAEERVELWLVRGGDVTNAIGLLGTVDVPAGTDEIDVLVHTADNDLTLLASAPEGEADLVEQVDDATS